MKVSVLIMTYNHASFIRQAIDSVLMQRCNFDWEILISEDCSTDGTRAIVAQYEREHPGRIRLLLSSQNLHNNQIVVRGIEASKGKYIALLDGDDFWISPEKLQRQAAFLDTHPDCAICFHNAKTVTEGKEEESRNWTPVNHPEITSFKQLWFGNFIATSSTMFRRGLIEYLPRWYDDFFPITDWPLHILNAEHGDIGYLNETMSVYRLHDGGCYSRLSAREQQRETLRFYHRMNKNLNYKYNSLAKLAISKYFIEWAEEYLKRGEIDAAKACYNAGLTGRPINEFTSFRQLLRIGRQLYLPRRTRYVGFA